MDNTVHFISGLPRSGSTLLAGILRQNPRFHAAMSSPVSGLLNGALEQMGASSEFYPFFDENRRKRICRALFDAYYDDLTDYEVLFDTSRTWTARLHQLVELFDDFKVICCVRDPAWIMDSFERIHRRNPFDYSRMFSAGNRQTVYSRCESLIQPGGAVGMAWTALKEAFYGDHAERLLLVDYDLLAQHPQKTLSLIYEFLGEPAFGHDFNNVEYSQEDFDSKLGTKGLHTVKREVSFTPRRTILPPDLFHKYSEMAFWRDTSASAAHVIAAKSA